MAEYSITSKFSALDDNFTVPMPNWVLNRASDVATLPVENGPFTTANSSQTVRARVTIKSNRMAYTDTIFTDASTANERTFYSPDCVFVLPIGYREIYFPFSRKIDPSVGNRYTGIEEEGILQGKYAPFFFRKSSSGNRYTVGGAIALNPESREILSSNVSPVYTASRFVSQKFRDASSASSRYNNEINNVLTDFCGMPSNTAYPGLEALTQFGTKNLYYNTLPFGRNYIFIDSSYGINVNYNPVYLNSNADAAWNNSINLDTNNLYSLFPKIIFVNSAEEYDALFTMSDEEFNSKIVNGPEYVAQNQGDPEQSEPYAPGGPSGPASGPGTFNPGLSDDVSTGIPAGSDIGQDSSTGMYTRYLMNTQHLQLLGDWVYDPDLGLSLIVAALSAIYGKPAESMISLLSFPFSLSAPLTGITTNVQPLYFGHQPTGAGFIALTSGSCQLDWGTITLSEYWGNFLDYAPHTKIELYLPWGTGFVQIDPGQCLPGTLRVVTNIEFARGSCVHNVVNSQGCVIGTYAGQPGSMVPLISSDIAAKRAGLVVSAVSLAVGGAVGAVGSGSSQLAQSSAGRAYSQFMDVNKRKGIGKTLNYLDGKERGLQGRAMNAAERAFSDSSPVDTRRASGMANRLASNSAIASGRHPAQVQRNGGFGDASAGMMVQYPYVIISRPEQNVPASYGNHYGYPSNIFESLQFMKGYTEISAIHLNGIPCTDSEMAELEEILSGGVIF